MKSYFITIGDPLNTPILPSTPSLETGAGLVHPILKAYCSHRVQTSSFSAKFAGFVSS